MINIGVALFAHKEEQINVTGSKINMSGIAGLNCSEHRKNIGSPKISCAAKIFDLIYEKKYSFSAYENITSSTIYCRIEETKMIYDGTEMKYLDGKSNISSVFKMIPDVLYELSQWGTNEELKECFNKIVEKKKIFGNIEESDVLMFCDSYYYGCARDKKNIEESSVSQEEITAAFRTGDYQIHSIKNVLPIDSLETESYEATMKPIAKKENKKKNNFLEECKSGKYIIQYEWPVQMRQYIKKLSFLDNFETTREFEEIVKKIVFRSNRILERMNKGLTGAEAIGNDYLNIMLLGKPGTGKTTLAYALSAATGMPVCTTVHNKHTDEDEYEGKTKIVDSNPAFVETDSLMFHENGGIDINEEINLADPSVTMGGLGQKIEYPFIVKKNGYETKVRHPLNVVIATMNVGTNGSNPLNQALANRFKTPYILDDPTSDTFINILMKNSKKERDVCEWVYNAYERTIQHLKSPAINEDEICQNLSIRTCLGAIENMEEGQLPQRALINSIVGAVAIVDLEVARRMQKEVIEILPNPPFTLD